MSNFPALNKVSSGELAGSTSATRMPDISARLAIIKAVSTNTGNVYIGGAGVTVADGATDTTTGLELRPGDMTPLLPIANLKAMYYICVNATDDLTYIVFE